MEEQHMADGGDGVLAAVSGGADSVCLLFLLHELAGELGIRLAAFHLNHGLRGAEADRDETFVRELCSRLEVPLTVIQEDVSGYARENGLSEEEAGRILRYRHLEEAVTVHSCEKIATAHHKDDDAETVLLNLFRGSGLKGLGGIRPVRGKIIRPLLCLTRREIEEYLAGQGLSWCEDSTNRENRYARNKIRNELLPWVKENLNEQAVSHILNTSALAAQADEYFTRQAEMILDRDQGGVRAEIPISVFDAQPDIMKTYLVRAMVMRVSGSGKDISERHIRAACSLTGPGGGTEIMLPYGLRAVRTYEALSITAGEEKRDMPGETTEFRVFSWKKDLEIPKNQCTKWFDYDKIKGTLSVRTRREGDFFLLPGGKKKLLRRYLIDEKIPEQERDRIWLLTEGSHVLWVIGYRISEYYKVTEETQNVLEVKRCKGEDHG